jgi:YVTN family beta-propeller protein
MSRRRNRICIAVLGLSLAGPSWPGGRLLAASATFGEVVRLGGTPSDAVLDESRGRLYLVNLAANRVDVYSYLDRALVNAYGTGDTPVAAAMSMDHRYLYVTNNGASSLTVIDLNANSVVQTVSLTAKPEGVEVGADGRVLISTEGTSSTDQINSLLLFDRSQSQGSQVTAVAFPPPPATPSSLTAVTTGRPATTFRGKLTRTPDGNFIIGLSTVNNNAQTIVFVYEVQSASILRSRTVTGQSTVLSVSPDGSRFMAGYTLYDTATLNVIGQYNAANVPFPLSSSATTTPSFNSTTNMGGSVFAPDGQTLYSAFNVAPVTTPASRPQASTLLVTNPRNLLVRLGIKIPESIVAKMLITSDGAQAFGLSESGLLYLPLSTLYDYPILMPETTVVFLAVDDCNRGLAKARVRIDNIGKGKLTFSVPDATAALVAQASSGVAPATVEFTMEPGRTNVTRYYGTNLYSGAVTNTGAPLSINLNTPDAINVPNTIRVYMNTRQPDQRGVVFPLPTGQTTTEGLQDILVDEQRKRVYITNASYNRIEVFDTVKQRFVDPIEVGQMPHQMAWVGDGKRLYVANTGGETISIVDLDTGAITGTVTFPARPRSGTSNPVSPQAIANGLFGLQIAMSDGSLWKASGTEATVRPASSIIPAQLTVSGNNGPVRMLATTDMQMIGTLAGNGTIYRYDSLTDSYTYSTRPYTAANITGYWGPMAAGPTGSYFAVNGFILTTDLSLVGGSESPTATTTLPMATRRNVAALGAVDADRFLRLTTVVKSQITATANGDARPTLELLDLRDNSVTLVGAVAENPVQSLFGTTRINVPPRQIAVDAAGTAYIISLSGMTMVPLTPAGASRPQIASSTSAILNATDGSRTIRPGSFILISGSNLAGTVTTDLLPPPTVLGGSCVTFSDLQLPLLQTSGNRILAQVPDTASPGSYVAVVRSLATGQRSDPVVVTVQ